MSTNPEQDALRERWTLEGRIPLSGVADGAVWRRARSVATGEAVVLFVVRGETALEAADAVRRAYLVEDPRLLPVQEIVVLDDPREESDSPSTGGGEGGPTTVVEYPMPPAPPLAALLTGGPLHPETARAIIGETATGLEAARRRGVRHQFLDSNRVFVDTRSGGVHVLGIGVEAASHPGLDRSREVASFQDTAALVALLYRALTGRTPQHDGTGTVPRPSTLVDTDIPADLDLLCDLVLNESADDIPETTRGLIEALEPWQSIPVTFEAYPRTAAGGSPADGFSAGGSATGGSETSDAAAADEGSADGVDAPERGTPTPAAPRESTAEAEGETADTGAAGATDAASAAGATGAAGAAGAVGAVGAAGAVAGAAALTPSSTVDASGEGSATGAHTDPESGSDAAPVAGPGPATEPAPAEAALAGTSSADGATTALPPVAEREGSPAEERSDAAADPSDGPSDAPREDHSAAASTLVKDLHLDEKRDSSAFPGHLDITTPRPASAGQGPADGTGAHGAGEHGTGAGAAGAAGAAGIAGAGIAAAASAGAGGAQAAHPAEPAAARPPSAQPPPPGPAPDQDLPARTAGTHWPLSPAGSPAGSAGRAEQPAPGSGTATADQAAPTPSAAPEQERSEDVTAADQPTEAMPPVGAAATDHAVHETGPIVVQGRRSSLLDGSPEGASAAPGRSSLLRDVVGVAVDADDPDTFTLGPRDREKRSLQSQWIIVGGVIVVMIALVFAVTAITRDLREIIADPLATSQPATTPAPEEETGEAPAEPTPTDTEEPELPAPELSGAEVFTEGTDLEPDNADQQDRITDGDPETFWSTKHYQSADYGGLKDGAGVRLSFAEPSTLRTVTVTTARNAGGLIELRAVNDDGSLGDVLASGELAGDGEVLLETPEPVEAEQVALWIPELPPDSNEQGRYRARIAEIQVG